MAAYASYELFARDLSARDIVGKVRKLRGAGENWARVNYSSVLQQATTSGPVEVPLSDLIAVGLLPQNFDPTDSYGQRYAVLVRKSPIPAPFLPGSPAANLPAAKLVDGQLEILVAGTGGRPMPDARARYTATVLGGGAAITRDDPTMLRGAYNTWNMPASAWATAALPAPQPGSVASLLVLHPGELQMEYLHRFQLPGLAPTPTMPGYNTMNASISFAAGGIREVGRFAAKYFGIGIDTAALPPGDPVLSATPYSACPSVGAHPLGMPMPLHTIEPGTVTRAAGPGINVPTSCTTFSAPTLPAGIPPTPQWIPWQVIGGTNGLPTSCGPGQALQWGVNGWGCGNLQTYCPSAGGNLPYGTPCPPPPPPPYCPATNVPQSPCPQYCATLGTNIPEGAFCPSPLCFDTPWQCYSDGYWYYSCATGWIHGNDANCAPPPPAAPACTVYDEWISCPNGTITWKQCAASGPGEPNCSAVPGTCSQGTCPPDNAPPPSCTPTGPCACWPSTGSPQVGYPDSGLTCMEPTQCGPVTCS
jgi:hypothetical protein